MGIIVGEWSLKTGTGANIHIKQSSPKRESWRKICQLMHPKRVNLSLKLESS
jgi:hypothetical protein